jgi:hypothetical protein
MNGLLDELTALKARVAELEATQPVSGETPRRPQADDDGQTVAAAE